MSNQLDRSPAATLPTTISTLVVACDDALAARPPLEQPRQLPGAREIDSQDNTHLEVVALLPYHATVRHWPLFQPLSSSPTTAPLPTLLSLWSDVNSLHTAIILPYQQPGGCLLTLPVLNWKGRRTTALHRGEEYSNYHARCPSPPSPSRRSSPSRGGVTLQLSQPRAGSTAHAQFV